MKRSLRAFHVQLLEIPFCLSFSLPICVCAFLFHVAFCVYAFLFHARFHVCAFLFYAMFGMFIRCLILFIHVDTFCFVSGCVFDWRCIYISFHVASPSCFKLSLVALGNTSNQGLVPPYRSLGARHYTLG